MTVAASILLAVVVGGFSFLLLERWQRRPEPGTQEPARGPEIWTPGTAPRPASTSLFVPRAPYASPPGRTAESTAPLPGNQWTPPLPGGERTEPLPELPTAPLPEHARAPLPPPTRHPSGRPLWDDPPRDDDDEERPPGLWSGWAR